MADSKPKRSRIVLLTVASLVIGVVAWSLYGSAYHGGIARPGGLVILRWAWPLLASLAVPLAAAIVWLRRTEHRVWILENTLDTFADLEDAKRIYEAASSLAAALRVPLPPSLNATTDPSSEACYYVLDARTVVGNCASWWRPDGKGYTCDIDDAGLYTATAVKAMRGTDVPVHRSVVHALSIRHVRLDDLRQAGELEAYDASKARQQREEGREIIRCGIDDIHHARDTLDSIAERLGAYIGGHHGS